MPQDITVYKGERTINVTPDAYKEAVGKGWSREKPKKADAPAPTSGGTPAPTPATAAPSTQKPVTATPKAQTYGDKLKGNIKKSFDQETHFWGSVASGLNPFHDETDTMSIKGGADNQGMGTATNIAADTFNMREIFSRIHDDDYTGAAGLAVGTGIGLFGIDEIKFGGKLLKEAGLGMRGLKETKYGAAAVRNAAKLARDFKLNPEVARFAQRYAQPLFDAVDKNFDKVHKALDGKSIGLTPAIEQMARRIAARSESPTVRKIAEELAGKAKTGFKTGRSALGYAEAEGYRRTLEYMANKSGQWTPHVKALAKMLDQEIETLAKQNGVDLMRGEQSKLWKEAKDLTLAIAKDAKQRVSAIKPVIDMAAAKFGGESGFLGKIGAAMGSEVLTHISPELRKEAERLANKLGVSVEELVNKAGKTEKLGAGLEKAGNVGSKGYKVGRVGTAALNADGSPTDPQ